MKSKAYSIAKFIIGWPLAILSLAFIIKLIIPQSSLIINSLKHLNLQLIIYAAACFLIFYYLRAYIWYRLVKGYNYSIAFKESTYLWGLSELKRYTPGNI